VVDFPHRLAGEEVSIVYAREQGLTVEDFRRVLIESGPALTRPVDDPDRLRRMIDGAQLIVTARRDGEIVGVARCITDFSWNCYLSELAVSQAAQGLGIGKALIDKVREIIGPEVSLKLTSAPEATGFYDRIGMMRSTEAYWFKRAR
jgi:ribosomal protein S18 acetylase RimI-like enzyme